VSLAAARVYFEQVQEDLARPAAAARVRKIADDVRAALALKPVSSQVSFLNELCSCCGQQRLFPVGHRFMCQACDTVYDRFQDGDEVL
jgi:hypothetical protein